MTRLARAGERVCYATQEHKVAHETRSLLPADVRARSVHVHSPLVQVGDEPVCERRAELESRVFDFGMSLLGSICPRCPKKDSCEALAAARRRAEELPEASVIFVSHAGINQVFGMTQDGEQRGMDVHLLVDEMPSAFERVEVDPYQLRALADGAVVPSASAQVMKVVQELARAWLERRPPREVGWGFGGKTIGNALALAEEWGRLVLREKAQPTPQEKPLLKAADAVVRLAAWQAAGGALDGLHDAEGLGVAAMVPDACHTALMQRKGVLLSATPMLQALPGFRLRDVAVRDGAPVKRVMVLRERRGSTALTKAYYDDEAGLREIREPTPGEEPGIPWPIVDEALARALREADAIEPGSRVLFVTFKPIADAIRDTPERLFGGRVEVGHYGALRGKNDWMEGREREVTVVYCLGAPRGAVKPSLLALGLTGQAADDAWVDHAAGELTQAEGRLRLPRRRKPCTVIVEGDVAPSSWHTGNVTDIIQPEESTEPLTYLLEAALLWYTHREIAEMLGVTTKSVERWRQPGKPPPSEKHRALLQSLASPDLHSALARFGEMNPRRRQEWLQLVELLRVPLDVEGEV